MPTSIDVRVALDDDDDAGGTFRLRDDESLDAALPRAVAALGLPVEDDLAYLLVPAAATATTSTAASSNPSTPIAALDAAHFHEVVAGWIDDTQQRYIRIAVAKAHDLVLRADVALMPGIDKQIRDEVAAEILAFVSHTSNMPAVSPRLVARLVSMIDSSSTDGAAFALTALRLLLQRGGASISRMFLVRIADLDMGGNIKKKGEILLNKSKDKNTKTVIPMVLDEFLQIATKRLQRMRTKFNPTAAHQKTMKETELGLSCIFALLMQSFAAMSKDAEAEAKTSASNKIVDPAQMLVASETYLTGLFVGLVLTKDSPDVVTLTLQSFCTLFHKSTVIRLRMGTREFVVNRLIPLFPRLLEMESPTVQTCNSVRAWSDLLLLIAVIAAKPPGDFLLGDPRVLQEIFIIVRSTIPDRVRSWFRCDTEVLDDLEVGADAAAAKAQQNRHKQMKRKGAEWAGSGARPDQAADSLQSRGEKKRGGEKDNEVQGWKLEEADFLVKIEKPKRKRVSPLPSLLGAGSAGLGPADEPAEPVRKATLPVDKLRATERLLRTASFLVWRAVSALCGVISHSDAELYMLREESENSSGDEDEDKDKDEQLSLGIDPNRDGAAAAAKAEVGAEDTAQQKNQKESEGSATSLATAAGADSTTLAAGDPMKVTSLADQHAHYVETYCEGPTAEEDMQTLCLLARCTATQVRACALGAIATAAAHGILGDFVTAFEDARHERASYFLPSVAPSWEDYFLDILERDHSVHCRLNAVSVLTSLVGNPHHLEADHSHPDHHNPSMMHVQRRTRLASNSRAVHVLANRLLEENDVAHNTEGWEQQGEGVDLGGLSTASFMSTLSFTMGEGSPAQFRHVEERDEISRRCAFVLAEICLVEAIANREEMYQYVQHMIAMPDLVTARRGADALSSLTQNEFGPRGPARASRVSHPPCASAVVKRCAQIVEELQRSSAVTVGAFVDHSVFLRITLIESLLQALYGMLHLSPGALSRLVVEEVRGSEMLLAALDMPMRHSGVVLRRLCLNCLWIICRNPETSGRVLRNGLVLRLEKILRLPRPPTQLNKVDFTMQGMTLVKDDSSEDERIQITSLEILAWVCRGLTLPGAEQRAELERENTIGAQLEAAHRAAERCLQRKAGRQGFGIRSVDASSDRQQRQRSVSEATSFSGSRNDKEDKAASGSDYIDIFLVCLLEFASDLSQAKHQFVAQVLSVIARRCVLLRSKRAVYNRGGVRIMVGLLKLDSLWDSERDSNQRAMSRLSAATSIRSHRHCHHHHSRSHSRGILLKIHEYAAHALMNLSTEDDIQVKIAKVGLKTLLRRCGGDDASINVEADEDISQAWGISSPRVHDICSRILSNLAKAKANRNRIYKAELQIRTARSEYEHKERMKMSPRRPARPSTSVGLSSSPRARFTKRKIREGKVRDSNQTKLDSEDSGEKLKLRGSSGKQGALRMNFLDWYSALEDGAESGTTRHSDRSAGRSVSRLSQRTKKSSRSSGSICAGQYLRPETTANPKHRTNYLLAQKLRRPLSSMFSPRIKRPTPNTSFDRSTEDPLNFGASVGFGQPQSALGMARHFAATTRDSSKTSGGGIGSVTAGSSLHEFPSAYDASLFAGESLLVSENVNRKSQIRRVMTMSRYGSGVVDGGGSSIPMPYSVIQSRASTAPQQLLTTWTIEDEMQETSQYLPPLAELDMAEAVQGGEFFSPFAPAVADMAVTANLDFERDPVKAMLEMSATMHATVHEVEGGRTDTKIIAIDVDAAVLASDAPGGATAEMVTVGDTAGDGSGTLGLGIPPLSPRPPKYVDKSALDFGSKGLHSITLKPATPRNTMRFGVSNYKRADDPSKRETRLWSFTHVPGARVAEGQMTPYTLPDGSQVSLCCFTV